LVTFPLRNAHWPLHLAAEVPTLRWGEMPFAIGICLLLILPLPVAVLWWLEFVGGVAAVRICVAWLLMVTLVPVLRGGTERTLVAWTVLLALVSFFGGLFGLTEEGCLSPRFGC
jgi:hypothetical protein